jgi:hypothetical protein
MSVDAARPTLSPSRATAGWVLAGATLYLSLLYAATLGGIAPVAAAVELALPVVAVLWGCRDLLRVPRFGPLVLMAGLMLLIAGSLDVSGLLTGWPGGDRLVADLFLLAGMLVSVWVESRPGPD